MAINNIYSHIYHWFNTWPFDTKKKHCILGALNNSSIAIHSLLPSWPATVYINANNEVIPHRVIHVCWHLWAAHNTYLFMQNINHFIQKHIIQYFRYFYYLKVLMKIFRTLRDPLAWDRGDFNEIWFWLILTGEPFVPYIIICMFLSIFYYLFISHKRHMLHLYLLSI